MWRSRILLLIPIAALVLAAPAAAGGWSSYDETMAESWAAAYNSGDAAAVAAFYTEDGMRMPPNAPAVEGREAIQGQIAGSLEMGAAKVELGTDEMATSGEMGFARGTYVIYDAEGTEVDRGKWMQVGKKVGDSWYAYRDIWNSDNPLPMPEG